MPANQKINKAKELNIGLMLEQHEHSTKSGNLIVSTQKD
jgi:hypothetical protein